MAEIIKIDELRKKKEKANKQGAKSPYPINSFGIMKVTLSDWLAGNLKEKPHRVLSIPMKQTLSMFAKEILDSFDFELDHQYGYFDNIDNWVKSTEIYIMEEDPSFPAAGFVTQVRVGEVFTTPNKKMMFLFDYGDEWRFIIELIRIENPSGKVKLAAKVLEKEGDPPPQYPDIEA